MLNKENYMIKIKNLLKKTGVFNVLCINYCNYHRLKLTNCCISLCCRIDAREKQVTKAQHSSDSGVFGPRAFFRTAFPSPAVLVIDDIKRHDAATYRCRVDFRKGQTRSFRYNLTVIGEYLKNVMHRGIPDFSTSTANRYLFLIL